MKSSQIILKNIAKTFKADNNSISVLKGITMTFESGKSYAITGVSGSGKSTLMHVICGIERPCSGNVFLDTKNIFLFLAKEKAEFLNKKIGLVFQEPYLINELTVVENVMTKGLIVEKSYKDCKKRALELLEKVGLLKKANDYPNMLSGGQRQRVSIARALFFDPIFLLADEPTGNLDKQTGKEIINFITEYQQDKGVGLIVTSHDAAVASSMERVLELKDGQLKPI